MHVITKAAVAVTLLAAPLAAQIPTPLLPRVMNSPRASAEQTIGLARVQVDYSRPGVKGRTIFGGLIPYGQIWRAGADENTTITFSHDVTVEGQPLAAGTYGLHTIPGEDRWTILFSSDTESWGSYFHDPAHDVLSVDVSPTRAPHQEWMLFDFTDLSRDGATLTLRWAETSVPVAIGVDTNGIMLSYLRDEYLKGLAGFTADGHENAAKWCLDNDVNHAEALAWIERAVQIGGPSFSRKRIHSELLAANGRGDDAAEALLAAFAAGTAQELANFGHAQLRRGDVDSAQMVFQRADASHPDTWYVLEGLGMACERKGQVEEARAHYQRAQQLVDDGNGRARIEAGLARVGG